MSVHWDFHILGVYVCFSSVWEADVLLIVHRLLCCAWHRLPSISVCGLVTAMASVHSFWCRSVHLMSWSSCVAVKTCTDLLVSRNGSCHKQRFTIDVSENLAVCAFDVWGQWIAGSSRVGLQARRVIQDRLQWLIVSFGREVLALVPWCLSCCWTFCHAYGSVSLGSWTTTLQASIVRICWTVQFHLALLS